MRLMRRRAVYILLAVTATLSPARFAAAQTGASGLAAVAGSAEPPQVKVGNAAFVQSCRELVLGKSGTARGGDRAHVDQELHAGLLEFVEHRFGRRLFIADGEQLSGFAAGFGHLETALANSLARSVPSRPQVHESYPRG